MECQLWAALFIANMRRLGDTLSAPRAGFVSHPWPRLQPDTRYLLLRHFGDILVKVQFN